MLRVLKRLLVLIRHLIHLRRKRKRVKRGKMKIKKRRKSPHLLKMKPNLRQRRINQMIQKRLNLRSRRISLKNQQRSNLKLRRRSLTNQLRIKVPMTKPVVPKRMHQLNPMKTKNKLMRNPKNKLNSTKKTKAQRNLRSHIVKRKSITNKLCLTRMQTRKLLTTLWKSLKISLAKQKWNP